MSWAKKALRERKLILGLMVLALVAVAPVLSVNLLAPAAAQEDGEAIEGQESEAGAPMEMIGIPFTCPTDDDIRDPEFAKELGILGYVELAWMDALPEGLTLRPSGEWVGTMLIHFVSHVPEIADVEVQVDPNGEYGLDKSKVYRDEDGKQRVLDYSDLMSYEPSGILQLKAGETLRVTVTIKIPADFPMSISSFRLAPLGIQPLHSQIALLTGDFEGRVSVK